MTQKTQPLLALAALGQSVWLDDLSRQAMTSGLLQKLIQEDGLSGVTSNPAIFEKAIGGSQDYDDDIRALIRQGKTVEDIYQHLTVQDIQRAADLFRPIYDRCEGRDGFVSLEVSPRLAHDTAGTVAEAHRLWKAIGRPNAFIKVPATMEGLPAIQQLIREGININITLIFGLTRYRQVVDAYLSGLEARAAQGQPLKGVASVASFFLSRIDVLVDALLDKAIQTDDLQAKLAQKFKGQVAIANAKVAYQIYKDTFAGERFKRLAAQGARPQRVLWASTSTKNPAYEDVKYVEALIGPETINTMPLETLNAYRDHGQPACRLEEQVDAAREVLARLPELNLEMDLVAQQLETEGVEKFVKPFEKLFKTLNQARESKIKQT